MKRVSFIPSSKDVELCVKQPTSARLSLPEWFKQIEPPGRKLGLRRNNTLSNGTNVKNCMPFLDALTSGYTQNTWCEINFSLEDNKLAYYYATLPKPLETRDTPSIPLSDEYYPVEFVWLTPWITKLPKGYSAIVTHPFNRIDLPFYTLSGIIDADMFNHTPFGRLPFYLKRDFTGTIPIDTPMFQILPFKRENWVSVADKWNETIAKQKSYLMERVFNGAYKNQFRKKKKYE